MRRPRPSSAVTEEQYEEFLRENLEFVKKMAKVLIANCIDDLTPEEVIAKFRSGRAVYGGTFDVEAIPCLAEIDQEALDVVNYMAMSLIQTEH